VPMRMWLSSGDYFVYLGAGHLHSQQMCDYIEDALQFNVLGPGGIFTTGVVNLEARFDLRVTSGPAFQGEGT